MSTKVQKPMTQPINLMFRFLQNVRLFPLSKLIIALRVHADVRITYPLVFLSLC